MALPLTEIHTWWSEPRLDEAWFKLLDPGERERLDAYRHDIDRARFLTGTAIVRHLYADDLGVAPAEVALVRQCPDCDRPHGKVRGPGRLEVSVSHSGRWVVVAACDGCAVGVDVEQIDLSMDHLAAAQFVLTHAETAYLIGDIAPAFARLWTRKEAVLKALALGLRAPMYDFTVSAPSASPAVLAWPSRPELTARLRLADLQASIGHVATVAVLDAPGPLCVRRHDALQLWSV